MTLGSDQIDGSFPKDWIGVFLDHHQVPGGPLGGAVLNRMFFATQHAWDDVNFGAESVMVVQHITVGRCFSCDQLRVDLLTADPDPRLVNPFEDQPSRRVDLWVQKALHQALRPMLGNDIADHIEKFLGILENEA
ncbi:unnamed protein product [Amoebophrya sp. A120]|nr:unnamed protein product [Amoebophrya sp. A120]|eukprot:GSA120T00023056001.1